jgi:hypothetical protein
MKIIKLKESDLVNTIRNILNEQSGGSMLSNKGYEAILEFENTKGTPNAKLTGATSMGYGIGQVRSLENIISKHIESTITLERWFKINDLFRTQIYSFMFNADSDSTDHFKWLAGLAQSIDSSIDRTKIRNVPLTDPNVQNALELVNKTIDSGKINNYYSQYKRVLKEQYKTITNSKRSAEWNTAAQKYSWSVRVDEIESYYNGGGNTTTQQPTATKQQPTAATKQQPTQQPAAAPKQQQPVASKPVTAQGIGFLQLLEKVFDYKMEGDTATAFNIVSPLNAGRIDFKFSKGTYSCSWGLKPDEPYFDDNMKFQLVQRGGNITTTIVTGDGDKIPIDPKYFNGMSCRAIQ